MMEIFLMMWLNQVLGWSLVIMLNVMLMIVVMRVVRVMMESVMGIFIVSCVLIGWKFFQEMLKLSSMVWENQFQNCMRSGWLRLIFVVRVCCCVGFVVVLRSEVVGLLIVRWVRKNVLIEIVMRRRMLDSICFVVKRSMGVFWREGWRGKGCWGGYGRIVLVGDQFCVMYCSVGNIIFMMGCSWMLGVVQQMLFVWYQIDYQVWLMRVLLSFLMVLVCVLLCFVWIFFMSGVMILFCVQFGLGLNYCMFVSCWEIVVMLLLFIVRNEMNMGQFGVLS